MLRHSNAKSCDGTENLREDEQWKSKERSENAWLAKAKKSGANRRVAREWPRIEWPRIEWLRSSLVQNSNGIAEICYGIARTSLNRTEME